MTLGCTCTYARCFEQTKFCTKASQHEDREDVGGLQLQGSRSVCVTATEESEVLSASLSLSLSLSRARALSHALGLISLDLKSHVTVKSMSVARQWSTTSAPS